MSAGSAPGQPSGRGAGAGVRAAWCMPLPGWISWIEPFLPTRPMLAVGVPAALVYAVAAASLAGWLRTRVGVRAPYTRKLFHFLVISAAGVVQLAWRLPGV